MFIVISKCTCQHPGISIIKLLHLPFNCSGSIGPIFYHLKLDVNNFCKLNTNKREAWTVKTLALLSSPPHLLCMQVSLSSWAFLTAALLLLQVPSKCVILDPVLSLEGYINGGMRNTQQRAAREPGTHSCFCLICKNGKEPFCPRGFVFSR